MTFYAADAVNTDVGGSTATVPITVGREGLVLVVFAMNEGNSPLTTMSVDFDGADLTLVGEATVDDGTYQQRNSIWLLVNPPVGAATITAKRGSSSGIGLAAMLVPDIDISDGIASAVDAYAAQAYPGAGSDLFGSLTTTVDDPLIIDCGMSGVQDRTMTALNGQASILYSTYSGSTGWCYQIGQVLGGEAGERTHGYTTTTNYTNRACYAAVALKRAGSALAAAPKRLSNKTAITGSAFSALILGRTPGATLTATSSDGTALTLTGDTLSATFATSGVKTITITEALDGLAAPLVQTFDLTVVDELEWVTVALGGSSAIEKWTTNATSEVASPHLRLWDGSSFVAVTGGSTLISFGNYLLSRLPAGYGVRIIQDAVGGSSLSQWEAGASGYPALVADIIAVGGADFVVFGAGGNDANGLHVPSVAAHEATYRSFIDNLRAAVSDPTLPIVIVGTTRSLGATSDRDLPYARARAGEMNIADDANNILGCTMVDLPMNDNLHASQGQWGGSATSGRRIAQAIAETWYADTIRATGPKPGDATYDPATGWITIAFEVAAGTELVGRISQSGLTGFTFTSDGSDVEPAVAPFVSGPAQVAAQLATGLDAVAYTYQVAAAPDVTNCLFDNGTRI